MVIHDKDIKHLVSENEPDYVQLGLQNATEF